MNGRLVFLTPDHLLKQERLIKTPHGILGMEIISDAFTLNSQHTGYTENDDNFLPRPVLMITDSRSLVHCYGIHYRGFDDPDLPEQKTSEFSTEKYVEKVAEKYDEWSRCKIEDTMLNSSGGGICDVSTPISLAPTQPKNASRMGSEDATQLLEPLRPVVVKTSETEKLVEKLPATITVRRKSQNETNTISKDREHDCLLVYDKPSEDRERTEKEKSDKFIERKNEIAQRKKIQ